jgi:hypothetical protein
MAFPLRNEDVLFLRGASSFNPKELQAALAPLGFEAFITTRFELIDTEMRQLLLERGVSYLWQLARVQQQAVMAQTSNVAPLVAVVRGMLERLAATRELLVIDRYLFPKRPANDYLDTLVSVVQPLLDSVSRLVLITSKVHDTILLGEFKDRLRVLRPTCEVLHRVSEDFHDRFWIVDQARGLVVGTSLNGLGRRYALVDYVDETDVAEIVTTLKRNGLL